MPHFFAVAVGRVIPLPDQSGVLKHSQEFVAPLKHPQHAPNLADRVSLCIVPLFAVVIQSVCLLHCTPTSFVPVSAPLARVVFSVSIIEVAVPLAPTASLSAAVIVSTIVSPVTGAEAPVVSVV